jgi:adenylylsulfate kinase
MNDNKIFPFKGITAYERESIKKNKGACIWFTGLSGSGKSTLANLLEIELNKIGVHTYLLDGDNIRLGLNSDLGFSEMDRTENIRRVGEVVRLFVDAGIIVLTAFISPYEKDRNKVRQVLPEDRFIEVFVDTEITTCENRDSKGLYKKARNNEIKDFTGISAPYEIPVNPELHLINNNFSELEDNVKNLVDLLKHRQFI